MLDDPDACPSADIGYHEAELIYRHLHEHLVVLMPDIDILLPASIDTEI